MQHVRESKIIAIVRGQAPEKMFSLAKALLEGGAKKKQRRDKAVVDAISATIILQSYMELQRNLKYRG